MKNIIFLSQLMIFIPIVCSVMIYTINRERFNYIVFLVQAVVTLIGLTLWQHTIQNGVINIALGGWNPSIGIELKVDNLSMLFITMAVIMWWVVLISIWHTKKYDSKFIFFLMFLEGSFFALLMSNDFFTLFILIEIVTIISSILILYKKDGISVKAALYYLLFNSIGMMIYILGLVFLYLKTGTLNITLIKELIEQSSPMLQDYSVLKISFSCFFVSMCVKAALFPVYDWLPRAHTAAPASISALLSGLLVKTGLYSLLRLLQVFDIEAIYTLMFYLGFLTALSGNLFAVSQKDIKAILAFSTISQIGLIIMSLSTATDIGLLGTYMHIFNHFLFKSLLFLSAGILINEYGQRRVTEIKGIMKSHPLLSVCIIVAMFSITGMPLSAGFLSKTMIKVSMLSTLHLRLFQIASLGTMMVYIHFSKILFGDPIKAKRIIKGPVVGVVILTLLCVLMPFNELKFIPSFMTINGLEVTTVVSETIAYISQATFESVYLLEYLILLAFAYVLYKKFVDLNSTFWHSVRHFQMKFQDAIVSLVLFLVVVIKYID